MTESTLQMGYTSPMYREYLRDQPTPKRYTIGFVHFGNRKRNPRPDWEYEQIIKDWEEEDRAPFEPREP